MSPPRLALLNPIDPSHPIAERELALRMAQAVTGLGWEASILSNSAQVVAMDPDAVLCLHPQVTAKLTDHPWLACYWNPPALLHGATETARTYGEAFELTYDGYLVSGPALEAHLAGLMGPTGRRPPCLPFHVSSPRSDRQPQLGPDSRLFYVGSNWDGRRYPRLLGLLADAGVLALHGTAERWAHLPQAYQGPLPFDGRSVIDAAHRWGMGLCLHLPQHRADGVPNMRVFELAAAGALIVSDRHPFVERWFGDSVLYVDVAGGEEEAAAQILAQVDWVRRHEATARDMARAAQEIFNRHLCLEVLLAPVPDMLATVRTGATAPRRQTAIDVLLPPGDGLAARLEQVAAQVPTLPGVQVTALVPGGLADTDQPRSTVAVRALPMVAGTEGLESGWQAPWLAVLPPGVVWHAGHLAGLLAAVGPAGAAPAGSPALAAGIWPALAAPTGFPIDPAETLALPPPIDAWLPPERLWDRAVLRMAGALVPRDFITAMPRDKDDWAQLAVGLVHGAAARQAPILLPVPSLRLDRLSAGPADSGAVPVWPAGDQRTASGAAARPPVLAGISDLDPALAASIPWLWQPADVAQVPAQGAVWLYGAGLGGDIVMDALPAPVRSRVAGFMDTARRGRKRGLPVILPGDLAAPTLAEATVIIAAQYVSDILRTLRRTGAGPGLVVNAYPLIVRIQEETDADSLATLATPVV